MTETSPKAEPTVAWHLKTIRQHRDDLLQSELHTAELRRLMHDDLVKAYDRVRTMDLVEASGLTRQRIHQIVRARS